MHFMPSSVRRTGLLLLATVVTVPGLLVTSCVIADGALTVHGLVVDAQGQPVSGAMVKTRNSTVFSDLRGCFQVLELTYAHKHRMPFAVEATGFKPVAGTIASPGDVRVRVALVKVVSRESTTIEPTPVPGALGACEPPSRGRAGSQGWPKCGGATMTATGDLQRWPEQKPS
jgi:hypothetical protein